MRGEIGEVGFRNERDFKRFSNELLAAEERVHRSGQVALYSSDALQKILCRFCDIVADDLKAQSCTIQLKLQDIRSCEFVDQLTESPRRTPGARTKSMYGRTAREMGDIQKYRRHIANGFRAAWDAANKGAHGLKRSTSDGKDSATRRDLILRSPHVFPYCVYPKGAMWLAAANRSSPWLPFVGWLITDLRRGVTAEIVQEKSARVRDPFSMRKSRYFRKLGEIDPYLWTNSRPAGRSAKRSPGYFLNYYAVPIRIHSSGDVIGIIKIENKGFARRGQTREQLHADLNRVLAVEHTRDFPLMLQYLDEEIRRAKATIAAHGFQSRERSLLSLVYLAYDLANSEVRRGKGTIEDLLTEPYTTSRPLSDPAVRPPIQVLFGSIAEEADFFDWLAAGRKPLDATRDFYEGLNRALSGGSRRTVRKEIVAAIRSMTKPRDEHVKVRAIPARGGRLPDFLYEVRGTHSGGAFRFHIQICPSELESGDVDLLKTYWELDERRAAAYSTHRPKQGTAVRLEGEYIRDSGRVIHLRTDRLAARVQALTYAFPVPEFTVADSWKLSWAALEIGKLIERQISYRGTHADPTVPLTADDFFRVPISDLSFIDAVRQQYTRAQAALTAMQYHMPNLCRDLKFTWGISHSERVKGFRSYFDRIGQAHRAHEDALIAIWTYMLVQKLTASEKQAIREKAPAVARRLEALTAQIEVLWAPSTPREGSSPEERQEHARRLRFAEWKISLQRWLKNRTIIPDLNFSAPPLGLTAERRKDALRALRANLSACPNGIACDPDSDWSVASLVELLYRRYDPFVTMAVSLYLQLRNQNKTGYLRFYRDTRGILDELRGKLEALEEQVTRAPQENRPIGRLSASLGELRVEVLSLSTREFAEILGSRAPDQELLGYSVQGIYKRIRTLANVSGNQSSPALLNWASGRFDYLGSRLTCLFKNQVFAVYEEIWDRGDPFRLKETPAAVKSPRGVTPSRQRWLCLRTKVHSGSEGYNAWQVSALVDPEAVNESYWRDNAYTLRSLRQILSLAYRRWHDDAERYERLARARLGLQKQYCDWFAYAGDILDRKALPGSGQHLFGQYLGESPLDWLAKVLKDAALKWDELTNTAATVAVFAEAAFEYSDGRVLPVIHGGRGTFQPGGRTLMRCAGQLYKTVQGLLARYTCLDDDSTRGVLNRMDGERRLFVIRAPKARVPLVFVNAEVVRTARELLQWIRGSSASDANATIGRTKLRHLIRQLQGCQMDYLFTVPDGQETGVERADAPPLRGQADVMDRILCYILLHNPAAYTTGRLRRRFNVPGVTAEQVEAVKAASDSYNLFYYLLSLIPVEIQVRTALADTMAEQYHKIYKGGRDAASAATMIPRERLEEIGRDLDVTDREFEVQFEDYIAHRKPRARWSRRSHE